LPHGRRADPREDGNPPLEAVIHDDRVEPRAHDELRSCLPRLGGLLGGENGARPHQHLRLRLRHTADRLRRRGGPEGHFRAGEATGHQGFSERFGVGGIVDDDHRCESQLPQPFERILHKVDRMRFAMAAAFITRRLSRGAPRGLARLPAPRSGSSSPRPP